MCPGCCETQHAQAKICVRVWGCGECGGCEGCEGVESVEGVTV